MSKQLTRDNHYVPQFYLKGWSTNGNTVMAYDGIIPNEARRGWRRSNIKSTACWRDFYTDVVGGEEDDKFERLMHEREDAACATIEALAAGRLSVGDAIGEDVQSALVNYLIAQMVRVPAFYSWAAGEAERIVPSALGEVVGELEREVADGRTPEPPPDEAAREPLRSVPMNVDVDRERSELKVEIAVSRQFFISSALNLIDGQLLAPMLRKSDWFIAESRRDLLTSDNPVAVLRKTSNGLRVGISCGMLGDAAVFMPLAPRYLLLARPGKGEGRIGWSVLGGDLFELVQEATIRNATRYLYGVQGDPGAVDLRPQYVDPTTFEEESRVRRGWHKSNVDFESAFRLSSGPPATS